MTNPCKLGSGNYLFVRIAGITRSPVMDCVKLIDLQNHRPQRKRTKYSTVSVEWEGRASRPVAKAYTGAVNNRIISPASPVSCRWHVMKAICSKLGDLVMSMNMPREVVE